MLRRTSNQVRSQDTESEKQAPAGGLHSDALPASETETGYASTNITPRGLSRQPMSRADRASSSVEPSAGDESLIGPEDYFTGSYRSERGIRVQGRVEGSIESKARILIEEGGNVSADLVAQDITVAGTYSGKVVCRRRFEVTPGGVVSGEINTDLLVVREGGYLDGELTMGERRDAQPPERASEIEEDEPSEQG